MAAEGALQRILLLGSTGQVGTELLTALAPLGPVIAPGRDAVDLRRFTALRELIRAVRPSVIVNAAGYTAVDSAESDESAAMAVNGEAPGVLGEEAAAIGASVVHYSTDFVFDGDQSRPYVESDEPRPLSVYGRSKAAGEAAIRRTCPRHLLIRTSWVFASHGRNFLATLLRLARERSTLRVVDDQRGTPTSARLIAGATARVLAEMAGAQSIDERWGIYHLAASGDTTWYEYACYVTEKARDLGMQLRVSAPNIVPVTSSEYGAPAARPRYSVLDTTKIRATFGLDLPAWRLEVDRVLRELAARAESGS